MFYPKDNVIYDELWDVIIAGSAVVKGQATVIQDVFGFYFNDGAIDDEVAFVYRMRQVYADKNTGSAGDAFLAGDKVFYIVATDTVSPTPTGTPGTDSYFCGWAKKDAGASDDTVLINFDGTRYDETL